MLAICDAEYCFIHVEVGTNGAVSDGGIWNRSKFKELMEDGMFKN